MWFKYLFHCFAKWWVNDTLVWTLALIRHMATSHKYFSLWGAFQLENFHGRFHFTLSQKMRAIRGLAPTTQLPGWCYIEIERSIWESNGLIERPTLWGNFAKWLQEKAWISRNFLIERPPWPSIEIKRSKSRPSSSIRSRSSREMR